jgi:hypothetical protein
MDLKRGKVLVGAVVAVTMGAFAVPFCSNATASTGTSAPRQDSKLIQLAEEEHYELKEKTENKVNALGEKTESKVNELGEKTEDKAHELKSDAVAVPNAVHAEHEEHEAHEAVEASEPSEEHGSMRHEMKEKTERHVDEMGHEVKGAANAVESEHEAHEMNDR